MYFRFFFSDSISRDDSDYDNELMPWVIPFFYLPGARHANNQNRKTIEDYTEMVEPKFRNQVKQLDLINH